MVDNVFQQDYGNVDLEERVQDDALQAFATRDAIHKQSFEDDIEDRRVDIDDVGMDEVVGETNIDGNETDDAGCDP